MKPYPHTYTACASGESAGRVYVTATGVAVFDTASPPGPPNSGGMWSPETLLCASIADCFILTFRVVSRAARLDWIRVEARVEGILDRIEGCPRFTRYTTTAKLIVAAGANAAQGRELLERAEQACLIANSLRGSRQLEAEVIVEQRMD
jgi:organic hydroperoxide reductase OsmC/OhrA